MVQKKPEYSPIIGLKKTGKNTLVLFGLPAVLYILSQVTTFIPENQLSWALPVSGALTYFIKNWIENK